MTTVQRDRPTQSDTYKGSDSPGDTALDEVVDSFSQLIQEGPLRNIFYLERCLGRLPLSKTPN